MGRALVAPSHQGFTVMKTATGKGKSALVSLAATALLACSTALAAEGDRPRASDAPSTRAAETRATAQAPGVRLAALIKAGGGLILDKGVASVTRIDEGVYCIRPNAGTNINPSRVVVSLTPEYFFSELDEIKVQWAQRKHGCGSNRIAVYTLADTDRNGIYGFSNRVGFSIIVH
jgi:hypothetical protein